MRSNHVIAAYVLDFRKLSFAATSESGMIWMPSFLPFGEYINKLR